jgi:C-terminal processing protease CtpA/Prc
VPAKIQVNDALTIQGNLLLDIGAGCTIAITSATANKYKLSDKVKNKIPYYTKYGGVSGYSSSYDFRAFSVDIGSFKHDSVTIGFSEDKNGALSSSNYAGLLGNAILERFDVVIDFMNNDLYLKPNPNYNKPFDFSKLGFGYVDRNATMNTWNVTGLFKGSSAEIAGLKIDDKIISVNGIDIHEMPFIEQTDFWKTTDAVSLIVLRNGEKEKIEFDF